MPARRFRKPHRVKRKKSIFRNRFFWLCILFFLALGGFTYLLFFSSYFQLKKVIIFGNQKVERGNLENLVKDQCSKKIFSVFPTQSILLFNSKRTKNIITENFPQISEISIKKRLPNRLEIEVKERVPFGVWCKNNVPCFYFDREGIIFEEVPGGTLSNILIKDKTEKENIKLGEKIIEKNVAEFALEVKNQLKDNFGIEITDYTIPSAERLNAKNDQGWEIYFNQKEDLGNQLTKLIAVLDSEIPTERRGNLEYIDLRFSRVYYLYKQGSQEND